MEAVLVNEARPATEYKIAARPKNYTAMIIVREAVISIDSAKAGKVFASGTSDRLHKLQRRRLTTGVISILWLGGAIAALSSGLSPEPFFALFFSTFSLYVVFALKCREK